MVGVFRMSGSATLATGWWWVLGVLLAAQVGWQASRPLRAPLAPRLENPPPLTIARVAALGDPVVFAKLILLRLQAFDSRAGHQLAWRELDYSRVIAWLRLSLRLDAHAQAPLLAAARLYGDIDDPARVRQMIDFVAAEFAADPARRWPWLAHAVFLARHRLNDQPLALRLARKLARAAAPLPTWARQLELLILEDLGEVDTAKVLVGGLLASGSVRDPHERRFLEDFIKRLETRAK